jgi:hypothetical protein
MLFRAMFFDEGMNKALQIALDFYACVLRDH